MNNSVHFGFNTDCDNIIHENINAEFHKIELDELKPSTRYYYKVISDEIESDVYMFHTSFEENESIKFITYGDTRGVWDNWRNAAIVAQAIEKEQAYFALHTGDFVKNGLINSQWVDFFSISNFTHNCTIYPVLGNHENCPGHQFDIHWKGRAGPGHSGEFLGRARVGRHSYYDTR